MLTELLLLAGATGLSFLFYAMGIREANIVMIYILSVLIAAIVTSKRYCSVLGSLVSVLLFNFFFTHPRFTFRADDPGYMATFPIMLLAAILTSSLANRIKQQATQAAETAYRTKILFDASSQMENEKNVPGIIEVTCVHLKKLLGRDIVFYEVRNRKLIPPQIFPVHEAALDADYTGANEQAVANWVFLNHKRAGAATDTLGSAKCLYLSVRTGQEVFGVVGIAVGATPLESFENSVMLSIVGECALALKNDMVAKQREEALLLAKSEQLRANLLRSISHDLRTPLTSISGNAGILLSDEDDIPKEKRRKLYANIYDDSLWLITPTPCKTPSSQTAI